MTPPLIGVPCRYDTSGDYAGRPITAQNNAYITALQAVGATPFLIPLALPAERLRQLYDVADGILLSGGGDIHPRNYHQEPHPTVGSVQPERDEAEILLCRWAAAEGKPLFGICRGAQIMGVAAGGTMYQDVISQKPNTQRHDFFDVTNQPRNFLAHTVTIEPDSRLFDILKTATLPVNSLHHQALKDVPPPYRITAHAADGVFEGLELPGHPFYCGVQWHPEELFAEYDTARALFEAFVASCHAEKPLRMAVPG